MFNGKRSRDRENQMKTKPLFLIASLMGGSIMTSSYEFRANNIREGVILIVISVVLFICYSVIDTGIALEKQRGKGK